MACIEACQKNKYAPNAASHAMKAMLSKITGGSGFTILVSLSTCPRRLDIATSNASRTY